MITVTIIKDQHNGRPERITDLKEAARILLDIASAIEDEDLNVRPSHYYSLEYRDTEGRRVK